MSYKKLNGPQILSNFLPNKVKKILETRGFFEIELLSNWKRIVGNKFDHLTVPVRLKASKSSSNKTGTLVVKVDRSIAFAFDHEKAKIINEINSFFGYEAINRIELIQAKLLQDKEKKHIEFNTLNKLVKDNHKIYDELEHYPELKKNFEKLASKIIKS
tara:strand:+ start:157 stop:633 length:477 start_codon:yes stop_codon:yes gene_type:complete